MITSKELTDILQILEQEYVSGDRTIPDIAAEYDISMHTLYYLKSKYGLTTGRQRMIDIKRDWWYHQYITLDKTADEIATKIGRSPAGVRKMLTTHDIRKGRRGRRSRYRKPM